MPPSPHSERKGIARRINKAGLLSRSLAEKAVCEGRVKLNGRVVLDPEHPTTASDAISVDGKSLQNQDKVYLMLHKPRGLVTSAKDEQNRATVYECLAGANLPHVGPVGRLDKASEGLLLFTNDTAWANGILEPQNQILKTYHVQIQGLLSAEQCQQMEGGMQLDGELLQVHSVKTIRQGERNSWIEVVLSEGKNREIRRMLQAMGLEVLRLLRISMGNLSLGNLAKGQFRPLTEAEVRSLDQGADYSKLPPNADL